MAASTHKISSDISVVQSLDDRPQLGTTAALKAKFDEGPNSVKNKHNDLCDYIDTDIATKAELQGITQGQILPNSITPSMLTFDPATQPELDTVNSNLTTSISTTNDNLNTHMANTTKHLSIMTTQGDTIYQGASAPARLPKGTGYQSYNMNAGATAPQWMPSIQSLMTNVGDLLVANGANTPSRLAIGTALQMLRVNACANGLEYVTPVQCATGSYSGTNTPGSVAPRTITVGFAPKFVVIRDDTRVMLFGINIGNSMVHTAFGSTGFDSNYNSYFSGSFNSTGFIVNGSYNSTCMNNSGNTYYWVAIG